RQPSRYNLRRHRVPLRAGKSGKISLFQTDTSYLKFEVSGIPSVSKATIRLYVVDPSTSGGAIYPVSNNYRGTSTPWEENGLTWNNAPAISGTPLSSLGAVQRGTWVEFDVTAVITGNGVYSFALANTASDIVDYSSSEGIQPPQLVIRTVGT
ncbi:MAG: DNRLRE domain-containing protein, partial [Pirellulales bacterium]|nr:DNRLRE domain-containing protein [Pirellulales bacterium]